MAIQKNKLWLKGIFPERSDAEIRSFCDQYGKCVHMTRPYGRDYIFLTYITEEEALQAQANFIRCRYACRFAKLPKYDTDSTVNSSPTNSEASPTNSESSPTNSEPSDSAPSATSTDPSKSPRNTRRVHFSTNIVTQPTSFNRRSNQVTNGAAKSNHVSTPAPVQPPQKTVFRNGDKIIITYVQSASSFYAHLVSKNEQRHELIRKISHLAKRTDCVKEPPKFMALAPFMNGYYRAIIKNPNEVSDVNDTVLVTLIDVGMSLNLPCAELKPIPNEYTTIKISNRFLMDGIDDQSKESYGAKCLGSYIGNELTMECDDNCAGRSTRIRLIDPNTKQNINEQIKQMQQSFTEEEMNRVPAPLGQNQKLIAVDESKLADGDNLITLIDAKNLPEFNKQIQRIQDVANELNKYPPYFPAENDICLVNYSGQWHRAVFIQKSTKSNDVGADGNADGGADDALVMLIDSCKGVHIKSKSIRNITDELVHMPVLSFLADIKGFDQKIDKAKVGNLLQKFKKMTMTSVKSICESSDEGLYTIDI